ncbi:MAG TPA: DegT/DnrJ/EryC1/StrS family aminotransferase [Pyrinomonadaceae bacterium]|nr:DegT/DnrJ/EryC1/StrS family aminotransferase [Pyrinomonadaceae bacterium]
MISVFGSKVGAEEIANVTAVLESQWMGFGKKVNEFEERFAERLGLDHFAMVDSGSNALYMAVSLLNLPKNSEIIVPAFTWVSCAQAVLLAGHTPVFCDVELDTLNVSRRTVENALTDRTRAIMIVHFAGKPVDMNPIMELGFPIIEDAAHAVDSYYYDQPCGGIGDVGIYSFDAVKNLTTGEGGGITTRDPVLIERAKILRYCGIGKSGFEAASASANGKNRWWEYNIQEPFIKMLPTNIAASIGLAQLEKLDSLQAFRKQIWDIYQSEFRDVSWIGCPPDAEEHEKHSYFTYVIRVPNRDKLAKYLFDADIYTTLRYHPLHLNPLYGSKASLPNCELLNEDSLSIPLHPNLTLDQVSMIVDKIKQFGN